MPVLPFSNNIGPGNVPNPQATNWIDAAAYRHDTAYSEAKTGEQVRTADRTFLSELTGQFDTNPLHFLHQSAGLLGIGAKYAIESVAGVQYPSLMEADSSTSHESYNQIEPPPTLTRPEKRGNRKQGGLKETKKQKASKMPEEDTEGTSGAVGAKNHMDILASPCSRLTSLSPFKTCKTYDLELVSFNPTLTVKSGTSPIGLWPAPLYSFAIEQLGWYLNQGEFNQLNYINGCTQVVTKVRGSISLGILNSPFITQTATSNQTSANTNVNITLYTGTGLEDKYIMFNGMGTTDYASASGDYPLTAWTSGLYDTKKLTEFDFTTTPPTLPATHVIRSFNQLSAFPTQVTSTASANRINNCLAPPCYKDSMKKVVESTAGGILSEWEYSPNCALNLQNTPSAQWNGAIEIGTDAQPTSKISSTSTSAPINAGISAESQNEASISHTSAITMHNHYTMNGHGHHPRMQPSTTVLPREYIGFLPPTTVGGSSVQPIKIAIQIQTEIEISLRSDLTYSTNACIAPYKADTVSWPTALVGNAQRFNNNYTKTSTDNWAGNPNLSIVNT